MDIFFWNTCLKIRTNIFFIFVIVVNTILLFYINLDIFPMKSRKMFKLKLVSIKRTDIYY